MVATSASDVRGTSGRVGLPPAYWVWLAGTGLSLLGTQALAFGMTWAAAGLSSVLAGLVLTMVNLPRVLLLLVGGAVADRAGPRRVMLLGDGVMLAATAALAVVAGSDGVSPALLVAAALAIGVVDAFYLPASGTMPRRLVSGPALARAMAARQLTGQLAVFVGAPLGGALVAWGGVRAAALFDAGTFAVMLVVLLLLGPRGEARSPDDAGATLWHRSLDGLRVVLEDRVLRLCLLLVSAAAGFLLPVAALLVPLLGTDRGWSAGVAGTVAGTVALGTVAVAVAVLARGASTRPEVFGPAGLLLAAGGVAGLALPIPISGAVGLGLTIGLGIGLFTAHVGPLILGRGPAGHLSRIQAVVVLAQSLPLLVTTSVLGAAAAVVGPGTALLACATVTAAAALTALLRWTGGEPSA